MKKALSRIVSLLLAVTIMVGGCVLPAEAKGVSLSKTTATLYVGGSVTLKVNGSKKKVTWSTSKKSVATVSSKGKVTAKKAGTATISAKVSGKTYKCKVTVKNPSLSKSSLSLEVGKSTTITLNGSKISAVKSSNTGIATVTKDGKITAKKVGTATITVTGTNKKKYTCKVTVTTALPAAYKSIVTEYKNACAVKDDAYLDNEEKYRALYPNTPSSLMYYYHLYGGMKFSYALYDIDKNGTKELLICENHESDYVRYVDVYTLNDKIAFKLFNNKTLGDRSHLEIYTNGVMSYHVSGGYASDYTYYYKLFSDGCSLSPATAGSYTPISGLKWTKIAEK